MPLPYSTTSPSSLIGYVDGAEGLLTSIDADINTLASRLGPEATLTGKTVRYTTQQAGTAVWTPGSGKRIVVLSYQIQTGGTTAGEVQVWFGAGGDTTYSRGTDLAIFDGEFAPSATSRPGVVQTGFWIASTADYVLRVTTSDAINPLTLTVWGYEL